MVCVARVVGLDPQSFILFPGVACLDEIPHLVQSTLSSAGRPGNHSDLQQATELIDILRTADHPREETPPKQKTGSLPLSSIEPSGSNQKTCLGVWVYHRAR